MPGHNENRTEGGQFAEVVSADAVRAVFADLDDASEPLTATEVAEELDCDRKTAYTKLTNLADQNVIRTKKIGARARVWWKSPQE